MIKTDGVVLSAGLSTRANAYKMTLKIGGKTLIENCIENMYDYCAKIIVVGGFKIEKIESLVCKYSKVELVYNKNYNEGMFSSVKKGLSHVIGEKFFLTPGDYPLISSNVYKSLQQTECNIAIPSYNGIRGHPVLIKSGFISEICTNPGYNSLRDFINSRSYTIVDVSDIGILLDIDTEEDYNRICQRYSSTKSEINKS